MAIFLDQIPLFVLLTIGQLLKENCDQTQFPSINDAFRLRQRNEKKVCCGSKVSRPRISTETQTGGVNTSGKLLVAIWGRMRQKLTMCSWRTLSDSSLTSKKLNREYNSGRSSWYTLTTTWRHQRPLGLNLHLCLPLIRELLGNYHCSNNFLRSMWWIGKADGWDSQFCWHPFCNCFRSTMIWRIHQIMRNSQNL